MMLGNYRCPLVDDVWDYVEHSRIESRPPNHEILVFRVLPSVPRV